MAEHQEAHEGKEYQAAKRKRRLKLAARRFLVLFVTVLVILGSSGVLTRLIQSSAGSAPSSAGALTTPPASNVAAGITSQVPGIDGSDWNSLTSTSQTINPAGITAPDARMIALPENGRVDMSYFNTVTFVGDSVTQGLAMYSTGIPHAHYCAYKGTDIRSIYDGSIKKRADGQEEVPMEALVASQPDNVYILLGTNDLVSIADDEVVLEYYKNMLDAMRANLSPGVHYYVQSVTPIRPDAARNNLNNERVIAFNNKLAQLALEEGVYYLDLHEVLAGEDGYLREEFDSGYDGIHLTTDGYAAWVEYLVTHTAYDPRNPYV